MSMERRIVHARVPKATDIEVHVSELYTELGNFVDIREFVVSLEQYGRGITLPVRMGLEVLNGFDEALAHLLDRAQEEVTTDADPGE